MRKIFPFIVALIVLASCQNEKATLSLNLEKGETYKQVTNNTSTIIQEVNGQKMNMLMGVQGVMTYKVIDVNDTDYEMDVAYESLRISMDLPQGKMEFSSEKKGETDVFSKILAEMINTPFQLKMNKQGKVVEVKNIEQLFESAFKKFPELPAEQLAQIKDQLARAYGEEAFKGNIEMATAVYPENPVDKGETWVIKTKLESGLSADMTTTYTYSDKTSDHYLILGDSKIVTRDKNADVEANGMTMRYDMNGTMVSEIKVDKKTGWIIEAKINQDISGDVYMQANEQMPDGMKIPMSMKNDMIITN